MTYVIALPCVDLEDRACVEECPVIGSPGGAYRIGAVAHDHSRVAALPRQAQAS